MVLLAILSFLWAAIGLMVFLGTLGDRSVSSLSVMLVFFGPVAFMRWRIVNMKRAQKLCHQRAMNLGGVTIGKGFDHEEQLKPNLGTR